ncbi:ABC transporter ATP-binding protein [Bosea sp. 2KB_26]|uniref:ABC transporter ATP-binding protein n=1 Tax=Bosea sp. 2KB_26 TaxID=3237475 RepID=UPI003F9070A7
MSQQPPKVLVQGLSKRYGEIDALQATDLSIETGEFLTLLGPSGSGKTTLLQMVCGLVPPSAGRVIIDGQDHTATPVHRRDIGLVFQHYALFPHLTVAENIAFPLEMRRLKTSLVKDKVAQALDLVRLAHLGARFPRELSGGQQQRVALARCFVYQPSVILMDEPLGALDRKLREHLQVEIKQLHRKTGATIIYVTHDQEEALAMSDRICLMNQARVEQVAAPRDIYMRPATAFAAEFIGTSNIFRGHISRENGEPILISAGHAFKVADVSQGEGAAAALVIRPEAVSLGNRGENSVSGRVIETIFGGADVRVLVETASLGVVSCRLTATADAPSIGDTVSVSWPKSVGVVVKP